MNKFSRRNEKTFDDYRKMIDEWIRKDAHFIRDKGDSRTHWRQIRWDTIKGFKYADAAQKKRLYDRYIKGVDKLVPVVIKKAPDKPRIAVSAL